MHVTTHGSTVRRWCAGQWEEAKNRSNFVTQGPDFANAEQGMLVVTLSDHGLATLRALTINV
jgi:hypothetical protein